MACLAVVAGDQLTHPASRHSRLRVEGGEEGGRQGAGAKDAEVEGFGGKEGIQASLADQSQGMDIYRLWTDSCFVSLRPDFKTS